MEEKDKVSFEVMISYIGDLSTDNLLLIRSRLSEYLLSKSDHRSISIKQINMSFMYRIINIKNVKNVLGYENIIDNLDNLDLEQLVIIDLITYMALNRSDIKLFIEYVFDTYSYKDVKSYGVDFIHPVFAYNYPTSPDTFIIQLTN